MSSRKRIRGLIVGPFVSGTVEDDVPASRRDRIVTWLIVCLLIAIAAPLVGIPMLLVSIAYLATDSTVRTTDQEAQP